jgi:microfibrillar-associated protein 1
VVVDDDEGNVRDDLEDGAVLEGDSALLQRLEEQRIEEEEDVATRRQRIKERLASRRQEAQDMNEEREAHKGAHRGIGDVIRVMAEGRIIGEADDRPGAEEESSGSSEYETESEEESEEEEEGHTMLKPLFVPRARRDTIRTQEELDREKEVARQQELLKKESKKHQTRVMLAESIRRQEELDAKGDVTDMDSDAGLPDDSDETGEEDKEFDAWRVREMARMKREAETREAMMLEAQDLERRRNMTDEERLAEDIRLGKFQEKEKKKWRFLQKYYHKGVFYMDDSSLSATGSTKIGTRLDVPQEALNSGADGGAAGEDRKAVDARLREYNEPTLEDKYNREALPAVLQVKKFGMRGRTKYTHLVDQDTTDFKQGYRLEDGLKNKYMDKRSGVGDINSAGRYRKKPRLDE